MQAGVFVVLLLAGPVAAIEDPADDVGVTVGGAPVHAPHIDILNVTFQVQELDLVLTMTFNGSWAEAPLGETLQALFIVDLDRPDGDLYRDHDMTILCTRNTTSGAFGCQDTNPDSETAYAVVGAGIQGHNVSATVRIPEPRTDIGLAGGSNRIEEDQVTAQDFTSNALPYNTNPVATEAETPEADPPKSRNRTWIVLGSAVALGAAFWIGKRVLR